MKCIKLFRLICNFALNVVFCEQWIRIVRYHWMWHFSKSTQMCQSIQECQKVFVNYLIMEWAQHGTNGSVQTDAGSAQVSANEGAGHTSADQSEACPHPWPAQGCHSASFRQWVSFKRHHSLKKQTSVTQVFTPKLNAFKFIPHIFRGKKG